MKQMIRIAAPGLLALFAMGVLLLPCAVGRAEAAPSPVLGELLANPAQKPLRLFGDSDIQLSDAQGEPGISVGLFESENGRRRWWAVLASAAVPGLGETLTGRFFSGGLLLAGDAGLWYGVVDQGDEGDRWRGEYREFALEHWSEERWENAIIDGPGGIYTFDQYYPYLSKDEVPLYVSRAADEREWFENLGKWDVFAWGWREYWDPSANPDNELYEPCGGAPGCDDPNFEPPLRVKYLEMRGKSNDAYARRDQFKTLAILLRVGSFLHMAFREGFIGPGSENSFAMSPEPKSSRIRPFVTARGMSSAAVGIKVAY